MAMNLHDEVRANQNKSIMIIGVFFLFVGLLGGLAGLLFSMYDSGTFSAPAFIGGIVLAGVLGFFYILFFMSQGANMILSSTGAKEATRKNYPFLYHTTEALSLAAGMSTPPKCYVIESEALNAYATGFKPEKSYIVVTTGLMKRLNRQELEGVLAHEMSHIKNRDIKIMLLAAGLVGVTVLLADLLFRVFIFAPNNGGGRDNKLLPLFFVIWLILIIVSPLVARMIKLAISRRREYLADANGALLTRYPEGLASALEKIKKDTRPLDGASDATAHLFISSPFANRKKKPMFANLFSTHPDIDDRIARLRGQKN